MAISPMTRAEAGTIASASDYNVVLDNVEDVDSRLSTTESSIVTPTLFKGEFVSGDGGSPAGTVIVGQAGGGNASVNGENLSWTSSYSSIALSRGGFSVSNGWQVNIPTDGVYMAVAQVVWQAQAGATTGGVYILKNGLSGATDSIAAIEVKGDNAPEFLPQQTVSVVRCVAGDYLAMRIWSGDNRRFTTLAASQPYGGTYLSIQKIADN